MNYMDEFLAITSKDLNNQLDNILIDGLKLKGYEFKDELEQLSFIRDNCKCVDDEHNKVRTYSVNGDDFLVYVYEFEMHNAIKQSEDGYSFTGVYGAYRFVQMIAKLLDDNLIRINSLNGWTSEPLIDYKYWDIRYTMPDKLSDPYELIRYICVNYAFIKIEDVSQADILSFFFWVKDELVRINETESRHLTSRSTMKSKYVPSDRAKDFVAVLELNRLSGGCPLKAMRIKEMKYSEVFETLLAQVIDSEGTYKD